MIYVYVYEDRTKNGEKGKREIKNKTSCLDSVEIYSRQQLVQLINEWKTNCYPEQKK
jgi:hypothetical protein